MYILCQFYVFFHCKYDFILEQYILQGKILSLVLINNTIMDIQFGVQLLKKNMKQADAEVVPSSSPVKVKFS